MMAISIASITLHVFMGWTQLTWDNRYAINSVTLISFRIEIESNASRNAYELTSNT